MKRLFDLFFSLTVILLLSPIFIVIAILIKCESPGPVLFRQKRVGRNFELFQLYKFRTMVENAERNGLSITVGGDPRVTKVGCFLRKTKIDELPQFINVFRGNMSIVGPRPEVPKYIEMFKKEYKEILKVRPGITDYAAIMFRNEEEMLRKYNSPEEGYIKEILPMKIELYGKYIREMNWLTDFKLILLTLYHIVK